MGSEIITSIDTVIVTVVTVIVIVILKGIRVDKKGTIGCR